MNEELIMLLELAKENMEGAIEHLDKELAAVRAGKASPKMLDNLFVECYGAVTPLSQVANINTPDARTIAIQPWDKAMIKEIEKAIMNSTLSLNPENNGEIIRLNVPPLTEDRRREFVKDSKAYGESAKVSVRGARKEANEAIKKMLKDKEISEDIEKNSLADIQDLTNKYIADIDNKVKAKETEILTV